MRNRRTPPWRMAEAPKTPPQAPRPKGMPRSNPKRQSVPPKAMATPTVEAAPEAARHPWLRRWHKANDLPSPESSDSPFCFSRPDAADDLKSDEVASSDSDAWGHTWPGDSAGDSLAKKPSSDDAWGPKWPNVADDSLAIEPDDSWGTDWPDDSRGTDWPNVADDSLAIEPAEAWRSDGPGGDDDSFATELAKASATEHEQDAGPMTALPWKQHRLPWKRITISTSTNKRVDDNRVDGPSPMSDTKKNRRERNTVRKTKNIRAQGRRAMIR